MPVRRSPRWAMVVVGIIASLLACNAIVYSVQRHRDGTATKLMENMVGWARVGDLSRLGLSHDDEAELAAARPWLGAHFKIVCDLAPPLSFTVYECQVLFTNGGHIYGDVDSVAGRIRGIHVTPPSAQR